MNKKPQPLRHTPPRLETETLQNHKARPERPCRSGSYLSLRRPAPAYRGARGREKSSSILPKTVPSLLCSSPSPSGPGPPAAGLEHLSSAQNSSKTRFRVPKNWVQVFFFLFSLGGERLPSRTQPNRTGPPQLTSRIRSAERRDGKWRELSAVDTQLREGGIITERPRASGCFREEREERLTEVWFKPQWTCWEITKWKINIMCV